MDERDGDDVLNMSTLKKLNFRWELTFVDNTVIWGLPGNLFRTKLNRKDINYCGHKLLQLLPKIAIKNVAK